MKKTTNAAINARLDEILRDLTAATVSVRMISKVGGRA